jgi:hypothetical protein
VSSYYFDIIRTEREDVEKAGDKELKNEMGEWGCGRESGKSSSSGWARTRIR